MTGMLPKTVTPSLVRKLNAAHTDRAGECGGECEGVGYCSAVWMAVGSRRERGADDAKGGDEDGAR